MDSLVIRSCLPLSAKLKEHGGNLFGRIEAQPTIEQKNRQERNGEKPDNESDEKITDKPALKDHRGPLFHLSAKFSRRISGAGIPAPWLT